MVVAIVAIALVIAGGATYWFQTQVPQKASASVESTALPLSDKPSIAVLPFTNMSNDEEQEYFADGITEDLITDISKISGLDVIARHSTFSYKGQTPDVREVGRDLGASHVIEGSVRKAVTRSASPFSLSMLWTASMYGPSDMTGNCGTCSPSRTRSSVRS